MYVCVCVHVCVLVYVVRDSVCAVLCAKERGRESERACVYVCERVLFESERQVLNLVLLWYPV